MTVDEIIEAALARCAEFSAKVPTGRTTMLRRIGARQEQLFGRMADINRDYTGADGVLTLVAGAADTADLVPLPMRVTVVKIEDKGSSGYAARDFVNVVPVDDIECALAPRMTLRDGVLRQIGTDLTGVTSLRVFYCRRPTVLVALTDSPDLPQQYQELLVIDLTKSLIRKALGLVETAQKTILDILQAEEQEMEQDLEQHLLNYNYAEVTRFGRTAQKTS